MTKNLVARPTPYLMFAAAGALLAGLAIPNDPAVAQQLSGKPALSEEITVTAPYTVQRRVEGRTTAGIPIETISVARNVYYGDLNLGRYADVVEFKQRVGDAAKDACNQLNKLYPEALFAPVPSDQNCVRTATNEAMKQTDTIVASYGTTTVSQTTTTTTVDQRMTSDVAAAQRAAVRAARSASEAQESAKAAQRSLELASANASVMSGSSQRNK